MMMNDENSESEQPDRLIPVPADLLETVLLTAAQAMWRREWTALDAGEPVPESVVRRLSVIAKVRALLKK